MPRSSPPLAAGVALLALAVLATPAASQSPTAIGRRLEDILPHKPAETQILGYKAIEASGDRAAIPALIDLLRFDLSPVPAELPIGVLEKLSGQTFGGDWKRWVEWLQKQTDIVPPPEFIPWKGRLLALIDAEFYDWFRAGVPHRIRMEEIAWGGVAKDGIPALTHPAHVGVAQATYLTDDELVFGVTLNGESRAYPHRILDWHELANDVVGGVPVALAY